MGKVIMVKEHLSLSELDEFVKTSKTPIEVRRWLVIRQAQAIPSSAQEHAQRFGLSVHTVRDLIELYNKEGPYAIRKPTRRKQPHSYLSTEEEKNFIPLQRRQRSRCVFDHQ